MSHRAERGRRYGFSGARVRQAGELRSARVEALRALAALGVFCSHVLLFSYGAGLSQIESDRLRLAFQGSARGLTLFFVLSGYLLYLPFARRDFGGGGAVDLPRYARNRILRMSRCT